MTPKSLTALAGAALTALALATAAQANEYQASLEELVDTQLRGIASEGFIIDSIRAMNAERASLTQDDIDAKDKDWRAQVGSSNATLIETVMATPSSQRLSEIRDVSEGLFTEIFVMGGKGLNVAASDVTSDYWQGDEAKWQKTYLVGPDAMHISEVELDESTQTYQAQVSLPVVDPDTSAPIGAITFGVNVEYLQ
ncbi:MAG: hypothetical protein AAGF44_11395 [Pseudomonadota bacterium]